MSEDNVLVTSYRRYDDKVNLRQKFADKLSFDLRQEKTGFPDKEIPGGGTLVDTRKQTILEIPLEILAIVGYL